MILALTCIQNSLVGSGVSDLLGLLVEMQIGGWVGWVVPLFDRLSFLKSRPDQAYSSTSHILPANCTFLLFLRRGHCSELDLQMLYIVCAMSLFLIDTLPSSSIDIVEVFLRTFKPFFLRRGRSQLVFFIIVTLGHFSTRICFVPKSEQLPPPLLFNVSRWLNRTLWKVSFWYNPREGRNK